MNINNPSIKRTANSEASKKQFNSRTIKLTKKSCRLTLKKGLQSYLETRIS